MATCTTGGTRLRPGLPPDWAVGDKTSSGKRGTVNDVAILRPPHRAPILVALGDALAGNVYLGTALMARLEARGAGG